MNYFKQFFRKIEIFSCTSKLDQSIKLINSPLYKFKIHVFIIIRKLFDGDILNVVTSELQFP